MTHRRYLAPEVVQTSSMDCGPAALKCLLEGFGIRASYGRLREACQTDVDGSSIDTIEDVARKLGLDAEQIMLPVDHLLLPQSQALPAIVVVRMPNGATHFVVIWRRHGGLLQIMDPATGRRWVTARKFLEQVYVHTMLVPVNAWREWAESKQSLTTLRRRLKDIGARSERIAQAQDRNSLGALDAAVRMVHSMVRSGGIRRGRQAARVLDRFGERQESIPPQYWSARPESGDRLAFRGAVLVHVRGRLAGAEAPAGDMPAELTAALKEKPSRPGLELLRLLRMDGLLAPAALAIAFLLATGGVVVEAILFRGLFDLGRELGTAGQRLAAVSALVLFLLLLLLLEIPLAASVLRFGRRLEIRLRRAFLEKIPRLGDRYFQSRLKSDMAERSHSIHRIRHLPDLAGQLARNVFELTLTAAGIAWLDPASAPLAIAAAGLALILPLAAQPVIIERDLRVRTHSGALSRFYLDALLGLTAIRAHGAERAIRREHGSLLGEWMRAGLGLQRAAVWVEAAQLAAGFGLGAWLLLSYLARAGEAGGALLLVYWALNLPVIGQQIALIAWQYPAYRNTTLRLLEPLGALEEKPAEQARPGSAGEPPAPPAQPGMAIALENVTVRAGGHTILQDIQLTIASGSHVAIVGPSGAGKSSLAGILLGWYSASSGRVLVDCAPIEGRIEKMRAETAWVDPTVHLWNRSFYENLRYGASSDSSRRMGDVIEAADLRRVLEKLPDGFETPLGEGGALVSGGEGQRVRLGRAMLRPDARLVILDEPFRGLERDRRRELLARARKLWKRATILCITHDVSETMAFDRVLVIEGGHLMEDGAPSELAARHESRYAAMLRAEREVQEGLWSSGDWRHLRLQDGRICVRACATESPS